MLNDAESRLWHRLLMQDNLRLYKQKLESMAVSKSTSPSSLSQTFEIQFLVGQAYLPDDDGEEGLIDVFAALERCAHRISRRFIDGLVCSEKTWRVLMNTIQRMVQQRHQDLIMDASFSLVLRFITVVDDMETPSDVLMARSLFNVLPWLSELHWNFCRVTSHGLQVLLSSSYAKDDENHSNMDPSIPIQPPNRFRLLSLEGNPDIGNTGLDILFQTLQSKESPSFGKHLQTLSVERIGASTTGIVRLCQTLQNQSSLQCLNLMGNYTQDPKTQQAIHDLVQKNPSIQQLQVEGHSLTRTFWLQANQAGRKYFYLPVHESPSSHPSSLWSVWAFLLERLAQPARDPSILFFFLRSKPEWIGDLT